MLKSKNWTPEQIETFVTMWKEGYYTKDIAKELGKTHASVKMFSQRHRETLGLEQRLDVTKRPRSRRAGFDREWYGPVPFGHWALTKPWRQL